MSKITAKELAAMLDGQRMDETDEFDLCTTCQDEVYKFIACKRICE